jgi:hypothetical protein
MQTQTRLLLAACVLACACAGAVAREPHSGKPSKPAAGTVVTAQLPPPKAGTTDLHFNEFYKMPVGPRGLEPSAKLLSLVNERVRLVGYMVHEGNPQPGVMILSPLPVSAPDAEDGPADDYPPQIVYVHLPPKKSASVVPWTPQLLVFEGTLEVGARAESDGRASMVRLITH